MTNGGKIFGHGSKMVVQVTSEARYSFTFKVAVFRFQVKARWTPPLLSLAVLTFMWAYMPNCGCVDSSTDVPAFFSSASSVSNVTLARISTLGMIEMSG